jgi:hypothetical protein
MKILKKIMTAIKTVLTLLLTCRMDLVRLMISTGSLIWASLLLWQLSESESIITHSQTLMLSVMPAFSWLILMRRV